MASPPSLLLLPAPPLPPTKPALNAAYRAPLTAVLTRLSAAIPHSSSASPSVLVVAIASPILRGPAPPRKYLDWRAAQSLLASVYTLLSAICSERAIDTDSDDDDNGRIDARVVLVDHARGRRYERDPEGVHAKNCTTVYDLASFATEVWPWAVVFHPSTEAGYELLSDYLALAGGRHTLLQSQLVAVEGGLSLSTDVGTAEAVSSSSSSSSSSTGGGGKCSTVCLGGTFDHLHAGHKLLLHAAALLLHVPEEHSGKQSALIIGLSADELLKNKKYADELQSWTLRAERILDFLSTVLSCGPSMEHHSTGGGDDDDDTLATFRDGRVVVRIAVLRDTYGPTMVEKDVDALVLSGETRSGGVAINEKRRERGLTAIDIYEIDVLDANGMMDDDDDDDRGDGSSIRARNGFAAKISSTAIRQQQAEKRAKGKT